MTIKKKNYVQCLGKIPIFKQVWLYSILRLFIDIFFVWVVSLLAGDRPMSPQFQKVHRPPLLPITDQFP